ncbi:hypothetical protein [Streptococcus suis]|uniref:hypothetical protein n=1 Tax=Streptococcus suis TaxID=1307 RepID=UPI002A7DDA58|nr:hypothetical protein [Streptococcus suis]HEM3471410.1 hypothetical protein [Streptococcus suis]HEM3475628.1 hypothetical protein [Streptococcus suis]HEM3482090.1 hypothetical protein [Streptococcus suis]HEM3993793.1 hypothetical protein [Streptococcus suis]
MKMFRNSKKSKLFIQKINELLSDSELKLSKALKFQLLEAMELCEKGNKISYLSYKIYPCVSEELALNRIQSDKLKMFKRYLEQERWKYYFGSALGMAFTSIR